MAGFPQRIVVVGTSCSGKSTFARQLAACLNAPHIQLDEIYWGPDWTPHPLDVVRDGVAAATSGSRWICDGNYSYLRDLVWPRAETLIWLNYSWAVVGARALRRTVRRAWTREELFAGNRQSWRLSFFSRDSILLWVLKTHGRHRRDIPQLLAQPAHRHLQVWQLTHPQQASALLAQFHAERNSAAGR